MHGSGLDAVRGRPLPWAMTLPHDEVTLLLEQWHSGDASAMERLMPLVYDQLRVVADRRLRGEQTGHTLQATALVNEAYLRLVGADVAFEGRSHFFAFAARMMRRILVDHARARRTAKRGGDAVRLSLTQANLVETEDAADVIAVHEALEELEKQDPRKARVLELIIFGGLTYQEAAEALDVSTATVDRDFRFAKAWLAKRLGA